MSTATIVAQFLGRHHVAHEIVTHERTASSLETAHAAQVPPTRLAKGVLLNADGKYVLAVTHANCHLNMGALRRELQCAVGMATSDELSEIFTDCEPGAVPPLGPAYGVETIWDEALAREPDLYFEFGDHKHLVHMRTRDYLAMLGTSQHGSFSEPTDAARPSHWAVDHDLPATGAHS